MEGNAEQEANTLLFNLTNYSCTKN